MKLSEQNISAITLTFEPKDFTDQGEMNLDKFKEAIKTTYIFRINIPVECYSVYYESEYYKAIRDNTDKKTKVKFYIIVDRMNGTKPEKVNFYFDTPNTY